jgi:hypothetical protein
LTSSGTRLSLLLGRPMRMKPERLRTAACEDACQNRSEVMAPRVRALFEAFISFISSA